MATLLQRQSFIQRIGSVAKQVCEERGYGNAQLWTCIAQACCETGYGTSGLMVNANAFFGIKATKSWKGLVYSAKTKECYDGTNYVTITDCFRAYKTDRESIEDYFDLIETSRYKKSLTKSTVQECITEIKNGGYATSPSYIQTIVGVFNTNKNMITNYTVGRIEKNVSQGDDTIVDIDVDAVAKDVIAGKYGNGATRVKLLGSYYSVVQKRVNEMLKGK